MTTPPDEPSRRVDPSTLRRLYGETKIEERITAGDLTGRVRSQYPAPRRAGEPSETLSQIIVYVDDDGRAVAIVHQYLRPDGTIGASGLRDPKWLRIGDRTWKLENLAE